MLADTKSILSLGEIHGSEFDALNGCRTTNPHGAYSSFSLLAPRYTLISTRFLSDCDLPNGLKSAIKSNESNAFSS